MTDETADKCTLKSPKARMEFHMTVAKMVEAVGLEYLLNEIECLCNTRMHEAYRLGHTEKGEALHNAASYLGLARISLRRLEVPNADH